MKDQGEYTEEDRIYGAWLGMRSRIHNIDYGQADEDFPRSLPGSLQSLRRHQKQQQHLWPKSGSRLASASLKLTWPRSRPLRRNIPMAGAPRSLMQA